MSSVRRDAHPPWTPLAQLKSELDVFFERGCRSVGFLGGEPTAYPEILDLVTHARRLGYRRIALCTNGTRLANGDLCRRLVDAGVTRFTLSIHSRDSQVEDVLVTRVPGNLARKLQAVGNLVQLQERGFLRDGVALNPVLFHGNLLDLRGYVEFFSARGVRDVRFNYIWPNGLAERDRSWVPTYREAVPKMFALTLWNEARGNLRLSFGAVPACVLRFATASERLREWLRARYFDEAALDPDNDVSVPSSDGSERSRYIWQEVERERLKVRADGCSVCAHRATCYGVWRTYADLYGLSELEPV